MAYSYGRDGNKYGSGGRQVSSKPTTRLTGFFKTKRQGLFVGGIDGKNLDDLITLIKQAKAAGKGLTTFLWENDREGPISSLSAAVAQDRQERGGYRGSAQHRAERGTLQRGGGYARDMRPIEPDPQDDAGYIGEPAEVDPFAED